MNFKIKFSVFFKALIFLLSAAASSAILANDLTFKSDSRQTDVVELYTSEGWSSCPPADR